MSFTENGTIPSNQDQHTELDVNFISGRALTVAGCRGVVTRREVAVGIALSSVVIQRVAATPGGSYPQVKPIYISRDGIVIHINAQRKRQ